MDRRTFLIQAYKIGGITALYSLGIGRAEASHLQDMIRGVIARQNASGVTEGVIGTTTASDTGSYFSGNAFHSNFTTTTAGTVRYAHLRILDGNARTVCVSLWDASGNELISGSGTASDGVDEWMNIDMGSTYDIAAATSYYVGFQASGTLTYYRSNASGSIWQDASYAYSCGGNITQEESLVIGTRKITIILNNTAGSPS